MTTIGIVGLGRMGAAMARRLREQGFEVVGWDRDAAACARAAADARIVSGPFDVASAAGIVITSVTEDEGVRHIFTGPDGLLDAPPGDRLFIEMSTLQPQTVRDLESSVHARGAQIVDAPVLGTIPAVASGTLFALVGGDESAVARARTVLDVLTRRVVHAGPLGSGHAMKLTANLALASYVQTIAEALALGESEGLSVAQMLDVMADSVTGNRWLTGKTRALLGEDDEVSLDIRTIGKDANSMIATGSRHGVPLPLTAAVLTSLRAAVAAGHGSDDLAALPAFYRSAMVERWQR